MVIMVVPWYCRFGNFRENFIFANSIKRHISDVKKIATKARFTYINTRQSDFAISRGFYFHKTSHMRSFAKLKSSRKFSNFHCRLWESVECRDLMVSSMTKNLLHYSVQCQCFGMIAPSFAGVYSS